MRMIFAGSSLTVAPAIGAIARTGKASSSPVGARYDEDRPVGMVQGGHCHAAEHDLLYGGSASGSDDQ
jgi:hypothetical protein